MILYKMICTRLQYYLIITENKKLILILHIVNNDNTNYNN